MLEKTAATIENGEFKWLKYLFNTPLFFNIENVFLWNISVYYCFIKP